MRALPSPAGTDRALPDETIRAAARGDREARAAVLAAYGPSVWALCRRLAENPEDAYQDVWARIFGALATFDPGGPASLKTWLVTIAHRRLIDLHRRRTARGEVIALPDLASDAPSPEDALLRARRQRALEAALRELPDPHRRIVLLHHIAGHPVEEIARIEGIAPGTVKSRLHRARARLAELLAEER
ncbi:MAG: sigma-70 family RNA polymerase sigma factor [Alphaproteobacteria bacterium]|nr:sigma-70 family RNA polymerase sigma factor [Alphaproteobacteria bacterium]